MPLTEQQKNDVRIELNSSMNALYNRMRSCEYIFRRNFDQDTKDIMDMVCMKSWDAISMPQELPAVGSKEYFQQRVCWSKTELDHRIALYHQYFEVEAYNVMNMILRAIKQMVYADDKDFLIQLMQKYFADENYEFTENILYIVKLLIDHEKIIIPSEYHQSFTDTFKQILTIYAVQGVTRSRELSTIDILKHEPASGFTRNKLSILLCLQNAKQHLDKLDSGAGEDMDTKELPQLPTTQGVYGLQQVARTTVNSMNLP